MDKQRFNLAVDYVLTAQGVVLTPQRQLLVNAARDGVVQMGDNLTQKQREDSRYVHTLIAAVVMVSQLNGNVMRFGNTGRDCRFWLQEVDQWLQCFANSTEFAWTLDKSDSREYIQIRNALGTLVRASAYPLKKEEE